MALEVRRHTNTLLFQITDFALCFWASLVGGGLILIHSSLMVSIHVLAISLYAVKSNLVALVSWPGPNNRLYKFGGGGGSGVILVGVDTPIYVPEVCPAVLLAETPPRNPSMMAWFETPATAWNRCGPIHWQQRHRN
ncbi:hypothetical protein K457DRAFT_25960 [Linnemannia elongata AG-77]|uniref:Uncharacterized protein n=1 Tax=Linnemannia elongata AG-77 TaxID=1314771 RepID=A0A197JC30_9FUNG|nr:hypothetical protein K457DRAFT_25960 [Linnemannia elongata AG-77]